jgi:hypothetical protein
MFPLLFDEIDQRFFHDIGQGSIFFLREALQRFAKPFRAFPGEINV